MIFWAKNKIKVFSPKIQYLLVLTLVSKVEKTNHFSSHTSKDLIIFSNPQKAILKKNVSQWVATSGVH